MPNFENHSIDNKRKIFEIRNRMLPISANFPSRKEDQNCWCGENENTKHIKFVNTGAKKVKKRNLR